MYMWMTALWLFSGEAQGRGSWRHMDAAFFGVGDGTKGIHVSPVGLFSPAEVLPSLLAYSQSPEQQPRSKPELHQTHATGDALPNQDFKVKFSLKDAAKSF